jgi:RNA-directed DNA polymerase
LVFTAWPFGYVRFLADDLLAICRPRGLPIGNLTSQFWSNCYLHPFDQFVTRELGCGAYLRSVDDFALFADSRRQLSSWKAAIIERLAAYHAGEISFAELHASIQGWIADVAHADSWGLRRHVLDSLVIRSGEHQRAVAARQTRHG